MLKKRKIRFDIRIKIYRFANHFLKWNFDKIDNRLKVFKLCQLYNS